MKRYEGILICSDIDGTLADSKGMGGVSKENIDAINFFMSHGGLFTLATGRQRIFTEKYDELFICNAPMVLINGTVVAKGDEILYSNQLNSKALEDIDTILKEFPIMRECHIRNIDSEIRFLLKEGKMERVQEVAGPYYKCIFLFDKAEQCSFFMEKMLEKYGDEYEFNRSWPFEAEMHMKGSGKGDAVKFLRRYYGEKVKKIICVGDYENDLSMIIEADEGVAVENAHPVLKKAADKITVSCEENAIAKIISEL